MSVTYKLKKFRHTKAKLNRNTKPNWKNKLKLKDLYNIYKEKNGQAEKYRLPYDGISLDILIDEKTSQIDVRWTMLNERLLVDDIE